MSWRRYPMPHKINRQVSRGVWLSHRAIARHVIWSDERTQDPTSLFNDCWKSGAGYTTLLDRCNAMGKIQENDSACTQHSYQIFYYYSFLTLIDHWCQVGLRSRLADLRYLYHQDLLVAFFVFLGTYITQHFSNVDDIKNL